VILADTTIWIDFLAGRASALPLRSLLAANRVVCHPAVRGEIALGSIARRDQVLGLLSQLPHVQVVGDDQVFALIDSKKPTDIPDSGKSICVWSDQRPK
jgi:predicted nucleic acid-binding protein